MGSMNLVLATVSETLGPEWAQEVNAALLLIEEHDHTDGSGVAITPAAMLINDDIPMDGNDIEDAGALALKALSAAVTATTGSLQRVGDDLYWISGAGASVRLTAGGSPVTPGSGELTVSSPASYPHAVTSAADSQKVLAIDSSSARTLTLPAATSVMFFMVKDASGLAATNKITVTPNGVDTIDGAAASYQLDANYQAIGLISDGVSAWHVV